MKVDFVGVLGLYCSRNWDGWLCWDDTPAGTYTSQNCPNYFVDFDPTGEQRPQSYCTLKTTREKFTSDPLFLKKLYSKISIALRMNYSPSLMEPN